MYRRSVNSQLKMDFKNKKPFEIFVAYIVREKKLFIIDTICAVLVAAIDLAFPYVSKNSMQTYLPQSMYKTFFIVMAILAAAYVLKAALYYVITVLGHRMGVNIESRMREDLYSHMQALSFGFYDKNRTGTLVSRLTGDLFEITELAHHGPENIIICALTIVGSMLIMFTINWQLTLVLAVLLPLCLWFTLKCRVKMKDANMEVKRKMGVIYSALENGVSGVRTAKAFANEALEKQKFDAANDMYRGAKKEYYKTMGAFMSGMEFTTGIMPVVVIAVGGVLIMNGRFSYIDLITFTLYVSTFINPVRKLAQFAEIYMQGAAGFERFLEIMRTEPEIVEAARLAELHDEIMQMPDGYDSYIGERGVMLSGGQKQRISIARVFLKNPPVLILDEATSALDTVTERRIQASLDRLCVGRTSIVIAHRLSTIRNADSIAVIEHGRIAEQGNHEELLALGGTYFSLAN